MTQQALAFQLGVAVTTIARYETEQRLPRPATRLYFAGLAEQAGQTDLAEFFRGGTENQDLQQLVGLRLTAASHSTACGWTLVFDDRIWLQFGEHSKVKWYRK